MNIVKFVRSLFTRTPKLPTIKPGCFLVLHGEQGSGTSTLARKIATSRGSFASISSYELGDTSAIAAALSDKPATLIIDVEGMLRHKELVQLKALITSDAFRFRPAYSRTMETLPMPQVILCTQDAEQFRDSRRAQLHLVRKA